MSSDETTPPTRSNRALEAIVVMLCLGVTGAMALPQIIPVLRVLQSRGPADDAASFIMSARRLAVATGTCVELSVVVDQTKRTRLRQRQVGPSVLSMCPTVPDSAKANAVTFDPKLTAVRFGGPALLFLPTGGVAKAARVKVDDERIAPRRREIRVTKRGEICVRGEAKPSVDVSCSLANASAPRTASGCSQINGVSSSFGALFALLGAFGIRTRSKNRRRRPKKLERRRKRKGLAGYLLIEVSVAALALATVVGLAFAYTGRVRAAQQRQELVRQAVEFAHVEADRLSARSDILSLTAKEDAVAEDRRLVRSVKFRRVRPDGAPADDGALIEIIVRVKYPSAHGPQSVVARRVVRAP